MRLKILIIIFIFSFFSQAYEYKYTVPKLDATNNAANRNNKGIMYMEMGHYNAAMTEFKVAISLSPNSPTSAAYYNNLALLYIKLNKPDEAIQCIEKAISLNPVFLEYYKTLVTLFDKSQIIKQRENDYLAHIQQDDNNSHAHLLLGLIYLQINQNENAQKHLKKYLSIEKNNILRQSIKKELQKLNKK